MELHCTLVMPSVRSTLEGGIRRELVLDVPEGTSGADIAAELLRTHGATGLSVERVPLEDLSAGRGLLRSGAVLLAGTPGDPAPSPPLALVVEAGPAAGTVVPLVRGRLTLGRGGASASDSLAAGPLADPELSREHATIEVGDSGVVLRDSGSTNGTWVDGRRVRGSVSVTSGQKIRMGSTVCTVAFTAEPPVLDPRAGAPAPPPLRVVRTAPPTRKAALIVMAVLPVLLGVGMALATGMWMFLAFTAVSAVSLLIPLAEGRSARRAFERRLAAAAHDDEERRRRASPDAGVLRRTEGAASGATPADPGGTDSFGPVHVRVGTADQPANVTVEPADAGIDPPNLTAVPLALAARGTVAVQGGDAEVEALLRWMLLQLAALPMAEDTAILISGGSRATRLAARFLPRTRVLSDAEAADAGALVAAGPAAGPAAVLLLPGSPPGAAASFSAVATQRGWAVLAPARLVSGRPDAVIRLGRGDGRLTVGDRTWTFTPDLLPTPVFEAAARRTGLRTLARPAGRVPELCRLDEVVGLSADSIAAAWAAHEAAEELPLPLGLSAAGPVVLDLVADGPHLLIAGTTGSGKSELLRGLVAGAAALVSPERLTFLFIDFKGGSGLEPLAGLPHCVGLVTDLSSGGMDRTLASLRAELKRRERLLAAAQATDIADYARRGGTGLPRLVLVVDEFRMLVEDAPAALGELMRIATVGRSLGMHLVMATQRPQGALSADIRANVTTCLALRLQTEAESSDVIGDPAAGRIPVRLPGRAFLSIGGAEPLEFQTASIGSQRESDRRVRIFDAESWLDGHRGPHPAGAESSPAEAARPLVEAARAAWERLGGQAVRRPVAAPLPERIPLRLDGGGTAVGLHAPDLGQPAVSSRRALPAAPPQRGAGILLGTADLPEEQRTASLSWDPGEHGHLALVGPGRAGTSAVLQAIAGQLACSTSVRHLYLFDAEATLTGLQGHPRVGTHVGPGEVRRAARALARLAEECSARLDGAGTTPFVVVISGWGSWISALRQSPWAWAEETLNDLVRDGPAAGLALVAAGERELVASRAFTGMPSRLYFPHGTTDETRLSWPRLPSMASLPGRAAAIGPVVRAVSSGAASPLGSGAYAIQCCELEGALPPAPTASGIDAIGPRPFRIDPLPRAVRAHDVAVGGTASPGGSPADVGDAPAAATAPVTGAARATDARVRLLVGVAGDEAEPLSLVLGQGDVLLALGGPGAGKTSLIDALPSMNPRQDFASSEREGRAGLWERLLGDHGADGSGGTRPVVLVDDADSLTAHEEQLVTRLLEAGHAVVATAGYSANLYARCPLALTARSSGTGLLLAPRAPGDGDVFGVRPDVEARVPPGRGVAVVDGRCVDVQLGYVAPRDGCSHATLSREAPPAAPAA